MSYSLAVSQAVAILLYICHKTDNERYKYLSTKSISDFLKIPIPTAAKVMKSLSAKGLIITKEGAKGGMQLAKEPSEITLLDIFTAIEQERPLFKVQTDYLYDYDIVMKLRDNIIKSLNNAEMSMKEELAKVSLKDLMN